VTGTAKLGNLADADVTIYKVEENGSTTLLWRETTSGGTTLEDIGKFDLHTEDLNETDFYLYRVEGGKDWDADDDGVMDANYTVNKGVIRSIALGSDIQLADDGFTVSYATELLYEKVVLNLKYNFDKSAFGALLLEKTAEVVGDVNGDGNVDMQDMLTYDPQSDAGQLTDLYRTRRQTLLDTLHTGKTPMLELSAEIGAYDTVGKAWGVALSSDGTKAFVADDTNGLVIVDVSDPANPTQLGAYDTAGNAYGVTLSGDGTKAYVADGYNGLLIVDVSDPANPTQLVTYDTAGNAYGVTLSSDGTKAYVANGNNGLAIIDVSDPANPAQLGAYDTAGSAYGVTLSSDGTKAYVADGTNGLVIVDVSNPANPAQFSCFNTAGSAWDIALSNDGTVYVADETNGLVLADLIDPVIYNTASKAYGVTLSSDGTKAYVAAYDKGLEVIDISDPANPVQLAVYNTQGNAYDVTLSSDETKAYVADFTKGLVIIDVALYQ